MSFGNQLTEKYVIKEQTFSSLRNIYFSLVIIIRGINKRKTPRPAQKTRKERKKEKQANGKLQVYY